MLVSAAGIRGEQAWKGSHHVTEDQKKKEGEQMPQAWPESHHPVSGGCKEAGRQDPHGNQIKQNSRCEIGWSSIHPTCPLPAGKPQAYITIKPQLHM